MVAVGDEGFMKNLTITGGDSNLNWIYDGSHGDFDAYLSISSISFGTYLLCILLLFCIFIFYI